MIIILIRKEKKPQEGKDQLAIKAHKKIVHLFSVSNYEQI